MIMYRAEATARFYLFFFFTFLLLPFVLVIQLSLVA
jgi:hypothetical protein